MGSVVVCSLAAGDGRQQVAIAAITLGAFVVLYSMAMKRRGVLR